MDIKKTANSFANFTIKRIAEIFGIVVFGAGVLLLLALLTYSPEDPNFIFPENTKIKNILGFQGSFISDVFFQSIGLVSYFFSFTLILSGINIIRNKEFFLIILMPVIIKVNAIKKAISPTDWNNKSEM